MQKISKENIRRLQASSTIRNDKNFGKQNIFDDNEETCWTSENGSPQWILIEFIQSYCIKLFNIQFQGGFVGQNCQIECTKDKKIVSQNFYPEDVNSVQQFSLSNPVICDQVKFIFQGSTDFFGRIVIYSIDIFYDKG